MPSPKTRGARTSCDPKARARLISRKLSQQYPDARCALEYRTAFELLVATILSAQCTDERVNKVTPTLFRRCGSPEAMAQIDRQRLEDLVRSTGFYRNKAKSLQGASIAIMERYGGEVPRSMDELLTLPGVARKTANVLLGNAFNKNIGVVVDTHVGRLSRRLGLTKHQDPVKIERDLIELFARRTWTLLAHLLISHGRQVCKARRPDCSNCVLRDHCPKIGAT